MRGCPSGVRVGRSAALRSRGDAGGKGEDAPVVGDGCRRKGARVFRPLLPSSLRMLTGSLLLQMAIVVTEMFSNPTPSLEAARKYVLPPSSLVASQSSLTFPCTNLPFLYHPPPPPFLFSATSLLHPRQRPLFPCPKLHLPRPSTNPSLPPPPGPNSFPLSILITRTTTASPSRTRSSLLYRALSSSSPPS